jgi:phosphomannomutase
MVRVMVEAEHHEVAEQIGDELAAVVRERLAV